MRAYWQFMARNSACSKRGHRSFHRQWHEFLRHNNRIYIHALFSCNGSTRRPQPHAIRCLYDLLWNNFKFLNKLTSIFSYRWRTVFTFVKYTLTIILVISILHGYRHLGLSLICAQTAGFGSHSLTKAACFREWTNKYAMQTQGLK